MQKAEGRLVTTPEKESNKYTITARLFKLINNISEEQLLILLKELLKDRFTAHSNRRSPGSGLSGNCFYRRCQRSAYCYRTDCFRQT